MTVTKFCTKLSFLSFDALQLAMACLAEVNSDKNRKWDACRTRRYKCEAADQAKWEHHAVELQPTTQAPHHHTQPPVARNTSRTPGLTHNQPATLLSGAYRELTIITSL